LFRFAWLDLHIWVPGRSPLSSAEVKNRRGYAATLIHLRGLYRDDSAFTFTFTRVLYQPFGTVVLRLIQINHQPDAKIFQFIILTFVYSSTCFGRFPAHHQELSDCSGSLWFYLR
jgi:hypothetical protein